jgi:hypothetical protein
VGGLFMRLLVLGLWFIVAKGEGGVRIGWITVVQLEQGMKQIFCIKGSIEKKKDVSPSELWFTGLRFNLIS